MSGRDEGVEGSIVSPRVLEPNITGQRAGEV